MNQEKPKNYYSLNLTEGRIFIIFISILIIVTIVAFGIALIISNNRKANDINISLDNEDSLNLDSENFSFYSELDEDNKVDSLIDDKGSENKNTNIQEKTKDEQKQHEKLELTEKNNENDEIVKINNTEIVYSSKYVEDSPNEIKKKVTTERNTAKETNTTTQRTKSTVTNKRYIVQVGSYINKKTAEEISLYYQIQGYPAYITETVKSDKKYYRLRIGPFKEKNRANEYLVSLKQSKYGDKSYISIVYL